MAEVKKKGSKPDDVLIECVIHWYIDRICERRCAFVFTTLRLNNLCLLSQGRWVVEHADDIHRQRCVFDVVNLAVGG